MFFEKVKTKMDKCRGRWDPPSNRRKRLFSFSVYCI